MVWRVRPQICSATIDLTEKPMPSQRYGLPWWPVTIQLDSPYPVKRYGPVTCYVRTTIH